MTYSVDYQAPVKAYGNEGLIRLVLSNLLSNAARYANSTVMVRIETNSTDKICLLVEDDGEGVLSEFHDALFVLFSRIDESRSCESGGIGLGLSLVELIVRQHRGAVCYFTSQMNGAGFEFCWPGVSIVGDSAQRNDDLLFDR